MTESLQNLTIRKFHRGLLDKKFSAYEITKSLFDYIDGKDKEIEAFISLDKDGALEEASKIDVALAEGKNLGVLSGVPIALKDIILVEGKPATAGSKILKDYVAAYDATVVEKLRKEQALTQQLRKNSPAA